MYEIPVSIFPWFRAVLSVQGDMLRVTTRNAVLIFPAGKRNENIPLSDISSCSFSTWYDWMIMAFGAALCFAAVASGEITYMPYVLRCIVVTVCTLAGVFCILSGIAAGITIEKKGTASVLRVPFYARRSGREAAEWIAKLAETAHE